MKKHWLVRVEPGNYGFFAMSKLDITQDGDEEVALCAWNGNTYIIDHWRNVVQFKFDENVLAFCTGKFAFSPGKNLPALHFSLCHFVKSCRDLPQCAFDFHGTI